MTSSSGLFGQVQMNKQRMQCAACNAPANVHICMSSQDMSSESQGYFQMYFVAGFLGVFSNVMFEYPNIRRYLASFVGTKYMHVVFEFYKHATYIWAMAYNNTPCDHFLIQLCCICCQIPGRLVLQLVVKSSTPGRLNLFGISLTKICPF